MEIRSFEILNPEKFTGKKVHIIGCGATGSHLAMQLVKLGIRDLVLWDFDKVESHNLTNQIWDITDIQQLKTEALAKHLTLLDPSLSESLKLKGKWDNHQLNGIVFCCVDSIEVRKSIYEANKYNTLIEVMFDPRLGSQTGSVFTYKWTKENIEQLIGLTNYKDDEIDVEVSLCGTPVNINTTLLTLVNYLLINFVNYLNKQPFYKQIYFEPLKYKTTFLLEDN